MTSIVLEEYELLGDAKYRTYMSQVDKALKAFEYTTEWADLIAALGKLNKVLLAHMKYPIIPRRIVISKRLAQCMHPALPSGVHLKALDTYDIIFKCMGTNRLAQELFLYSAGLFPLLGHAAMNVRPALLTVYETHFVPLGERLRPALNGLLAGVLLGLEEGSDHYERTNRLLESVCEAAQPLVFYGSLWECVAANPSVRLAAISFVLKHVDRKLKQPSEEEEQVANQQQPDLFGTDIEVMVKAVCSALRDSSVLVQRCALDFLVLAFPMHVHVKRFSAADRVEVVTAAVGVLLRRDMSLNRRLYNWLLGLDQSSAAASAKKKTHYRSDSVNSSGSNEEHSLYFDHFSRGLLVDALKLVLKRSLEDDVQPDLRPYRLLTSLLDKPEIGTPILEDVILDVFRALFHSHVDKKEEEESLLKLKQKKNSDFVEKLRKGRHELVKTANLLFGTLETSFIWDYCGKQFEKASCQTYRINDTEHVDVNQVGSDNSTVIEMCALISFLLDIVSIETYVETSSEHLPQLFKVVVAVLTTKCYHLTPAEITRALELAKKILSKVQPAWNAWDAREAASAIENENDAAMIMWKKMGQELHFKETAEVGKEATESLPCSPEEIGLEAINTNNVQVAHERLMQECVETYQSFFVAFLKVKVYVKNFDPSKHLDKFLRRPNDTLEEKTKYLEHLLLESGEYSAVNDGLLQEDEEEELVDQLKTLNVPLQEGISRLTEALKVSCQMLVELSSIPTVSTACNSEEKGGCFLSPKDLPLWLQYLIVSGSMLDSSVHPDFQLQAINTLLEMIDLLDSNVKVGENTAALNNSSFVIVMMPLLTQVEYKCIVKQTVVPQVMASKLWDGLGTMSPIYHLKCVTLLHHLHNVVPLAKSIERIVARSLGYGHFSDGKRSSGSNDSNVDAFQRFTLLWHLSRDLNKNSSSNSSSKSRTFDVCLLKMLNNLNMSSGPLKTLSQSWLVHAMTRGDVARIMEPLFLTLLDPSTARVSVLHCKIQHSDTVDTTNDDDDEDEHKIYAISTTDGEVVYHVSEKHYKSSSSDKAKRILALTTFNDKKNSKTNLEKKRAASGLNISTTKTSASCSDLAQLPLQVNPFALVPPELEEYEWYTRGYQGRHKSVDLSSSSTDSNNWMLDPHQRKESNSTVNLIVDQIVEDILDDVVHRRPRISSPFSSLDGMSQSSRNNTTTNIHPLHSHILLYTQVSDSRQILYTMQCIRNILQTNARLAICALSTTSLNSANSSRSHQVQMLLGRHRKSVFGKNFVGPLTQENMTTYRNSTLIEVLISTALYYLRSYYPNLAQVHLREEDIQGNREVQLMSIDLMVVLVSELILVVRDNGKAYATYISDLFSRCKVQKVVLHSLLAGVHDMKDTTTNSGNKDLAFTEDILRFNEVFSNGNEEKISNYSEAFQVQVLRLLLSLVMLEQIISQQKGQQGEKQPDWQHQNTRPTVLRYLPDHVIPDQPMFLAAIISALRQEKMRHLHPHWTSLVTSCLPFLGRSLSNTVLDVAAQLCHNLERLAPFYSDNDNEDSNDDSQSSGSSEDLGQMPADYVVTQLEALTVIFHYCLLDSSAQVSASSLPQPSTSSCSQSGLSSNANASGEILTNLLHVFLSHSDAKNLVASSMESGASTDALAAARKNLLSTLPRLIACTAVMWSALLNVKEDNACLLVGAPRTVRTHLLDLLSPIAHHHPIAFLSAIGIAWQERRTSGAPGLVKHPLPTCNPEQRVLVDLAGAIRTIPVATVIQTVRQVLRAPPTVSGTKINVEVSVLQFFYAYLAKCSSTQVFDSWSGLSALLRDCMALAPPAVFLALAILNQFVHRAPTLSDRKDQKELQEIAGKLVDACAQIGGSCLEQTTWLRRNLAVKSELQQESVVDVDPTEASTKLSDLLIDNAETFSSISSTDNASNNEGGSKRSLTHYAVPALALLGELLAPLLDIIYTSDEKEKVIPLLCNVMVNVVPYLKNHSGSNLASFRACSRLLASLSEYQYTRKAWKKDGMELLTEPAFFQVDLESLRHWKVTIDNLMTHDKTTFKDLMTKVTSMSQSGSLSLFSSKEQELEQRALLLKRLAFVIFCSEVDQYQKQMPDIQERLAESLRTIPSSPAVQSAVFLCFRVILVRMSPQHVTSLWPLIITEMVQIFSYLEQELSTDSDEWSTHLKRLSTLDSSWVVSAGSNGLAAHNSPSWLCLYLSVCKLLDLALALPAQQLPQFQMYRWAFVSEGNENNNSEHPGLNTTNNTAAGTNGMQFYQDFVPYVVRVAKLLLMRVGDINVKPINLKEGEPQLTMTSVYSLDDLAPFFAAVCQGVTRQQTKRKTKSPRKKSSSSSNESVEIIDAIIERDFLETVSKQ